MKYTLLMSPTDAHDLDQLLLRIRRTSGHRTTKSALIRSLITLLLLDETLLKQIMGAATETPR